MRIKLLSFCVLAGGAAFGAASSPVFACSSTQYGDYLCGGSTAPSTAYAAPSTGSLSGAPEAEPDPQSTDRYGSMAGNLGSSNTINNTGGNTTMPGVTGGTNGTGTGTGETSGGTTTPAAPTSGGTSIFNALALGAGLVQYAEGQKPQTYEERYPPSDANGLLGTPENCGSYDVINKDIPWGSGSLDTSTASAMGADGVVVLRVKVPADVTDANAYGALSWLGGSTKRMAFISSTPCDLANALKNNIYDTGSDAKTTYTATSGSYYYGTGPAPGNRTKVWNASEYACTGVYNPFNPNSQQCGCTNGGYVVTGYGQMGTSCSGGSYAYSPCEPIKPYTKLEPGKTYYITIMNRDGETGDPTCGSARCDMTATNTGSIAVPEGAERCNY